jgi:type I restriction-modification system DNA methylase subunit
MMISADEFKKLILDQASRTLASADSDETDIFGEDGFGAGNGSADQTLTLSFAQLIIEGSGFGTGQQLSRDNVLKGEFSAKKAYPKTVMYWPEVDGRPYKSLLFECELTAKQLAEKRIFSFSGTGLNLLETNMLRLLKDSLEHFESQPTSVSANDIRGDADKTLCVISILDDRVEGKAPVECVLFGTKCIESGSIESFFITEEVRRWAENDPQIAEDYIQSAYHRHFKKLGSSNWQDAFITGNERKLAKKLLDECSQTAVDAKQIELQTLALLDEIAGNFGLRRSAKHGNKRLQQYALPKDHDIGIKGKGKRKAGWQNPLDGKSIYDEEGRLLGYLVYCLDNPSKAAELIESFADNDFHNVLLVYPENGEVTFRLWQGKRQLNERLTKGSNKHKLAGAGKVISLLSRFFVVSKAEMGSAKQLAEELAHRAQHIRAVAAQALFEQKTAGKGKVLSLFKKFNKTLQKQTEEQFADTYAQTLTYGLLAARWLSKEKGHRFVAGKIANLLPQTSPFLKDLFQKLLETKANQSKLMWLMDDLISLLDRTSVKEVFGYSHLASSGYEDPVIHFYADFLAEYDPKIVAERGVYYTPDQVVHYIVHTTHNLLKDKFQLPLGLADTSSWEEVGGNLGFTVHKDIDPTQPFVQILDPATGTGTFLIHTVECIYHELMAHWQSQNLDEKVILKRWNEYVHDHLLPRINGFEILMAPYIVCHLRLGLLLEETGYQFKKEDRIRVYLTNTLEQATSSNVDWLGEHVAEEAVQADKVKNEHPITVVVGNPPYEREGASESGSHKGGWIRNGWSKWETGRPLLDDYREPASRVGSGGDIRNIYNLYVYFWRWSSWKVFEHYRMPGVISFITASSFISGPGFVGAREEMRRNSSGLNVLDLEGDLRSAIKTENVFNIKTPVVINTMYSIRDDRNTPGIVEYSRVSGSALEKLEQCKQYSSLNSVDWCEGDRGWHSSFVALPDVKSSFSDWPELVNMFPWQHSGVTYQNTWPISESVDVLKARWRRLMLSEDRAETFHETGDRKVDNEYRNPFTKSKLVPISKLPDNEECPDIVPIGFRSFDRMSALFDFRLAGRMRPVLWDIYSENQIYFSTLNGSALGVGPAITSSSFVPDKHFFCGRGGKDIIPMWRDSAGTIANSCAGMLEVLVSELGGNATAENLFLYVYALLSSPSYFSNFEEELKIPGCKIPITKDIKLFNKCADVGRNLIELHTYGNRYRKTDWSWNGVAKCVLPISDQLENYPEKFSYDEKLQTLKVGGGAFSPVSPEVWLFNVSGLQVVKSWLDYRKKSGAGRKSSELDKIRPECWSENFTQELLELIWVLESSIASYPSQEKLLEEVLAGETFFASELPLPTDEERKEPKINKKKSAEQANLF